MAYKTILTILTQAGQNAQLDAAAALARSEDAHLEAFCIGVDHTQTGYYYAGASAYVFQDAIDRALEAAEALQAETRARLERQGARWSVESAVAQIGGLAALVAREARFADLVVLGQPYGDKAAASAETVLEGALFDGNAPVLVLPHPAGAAGGGDAAPDWTPRRRVMIAWNQSDEALAAVRRAMPILKAADQVEVVVVDPSPRSVEGSSPGAALCRMLTRHGVRAEVVVLARTLPTISEVLNQRAADTGADLIVMGAYSHSRLREAILGGATRHMLERATVPLFMAR